MSDYGNRANGTKKGSGYFGELQFHDGSVATELGANSDVDGQDLHYPLIHPDMSRSEMDHLLSGGKPTPEMHDKAIGHALKRIDAGKNPFASDDETPIHLPPTDQEQYKSAWDEQ